MAIAIFRNYSNFIYNTGFPYCTQGLKALDTSVETFASGAWQALGSAWKGGATLAHKYVRIVVDF